VTSKQRRKIEQTSLNVGAIGVRRYPTPGPKVVDVNFRAKWS